MKQREKAILELGLFMGLRGCDIVNLSFENIDWDKSTIRFIQRKTAYGLELPMPDQVANALYRYIMHERPESVCDKVFIKHQAPYDNLHRAICDKALNDFLPDRDVPGSSFHVTRKTFATNLLKTGSSSQIVMEGLGHRNTKSIRQYLALNEQFMRLCAISLKECGLEYSWSSAR